MSAISQKSISGITSITSPAGTDDQISLHTSNTNEALKIDGAGNLHLNNHVNTTGVTTASNFKTGSSNLHSTGLTVGDTFVHSTGINGSSADIDDFISVGNNIQLGNAGVVTATSFVGSGAALTGIDATSIKDSGGNVKIQAQASGAIHSGVSTFQDIDVDGHTNLDNLSIAGVTTFSGAINSSANITTTLDLNSRYLYVKDIFMEDVSPELRFTDSDNNPNYRIRLNSGLLGIRDITNNVDKLVFNTSGMVATGIVTATSFSGNGANLTGVSGPEVYGFTGIGSNLQVRTTNGGADDITSAQYDAFEQVLFAPSGITFSINNNGNLIATF